MKRTNRISGAIALELAVSATVFGVLAFLFASSCIIANAARVNDTVCRDAARAAAQETTETDANEAAQLVVNTYKQTAAGVPLLGSPKLEKVNYQNKGNDPTLGPYVQVSTSTLVTSPIGLFQASKLGGGTITFHQTYAFPIVNLPGKDEVPNDDFGGDGDAPEPVDHDGLVGGADGSPEPDPPPPPTD